MFDKSKEKEFENQTILHFTLIWSLSKYSKLKSIDLKNERINPLN